MTPALVKAIDQQIVTIQQQLAALTIARAALAGTVRTRTARSTPAGKPGRRTFTAAQRAEASRRMRAMWAKRRKANG